LLRRQWRERFWLQGAAKSTEHTRIDFIGLRQDASGTGVLPHPIGLH